VQFSSASKRLAITRLATSFFTATSKLRGSVDHLRSLAAVEASGRRLAGVIVGRALYEQAFTLPAALAAAAS
jgi:phosphoribosylformimino-5-aminoimidazole carboxamide ribonucleotide (ProFAR) isomerase